MKDHQSPSLLLVLIQGGQLVQDINDISEKTADQEIRLFEPTTNYLVQEVANQQQEFFHTLCEMHRE